MSHENFDIPPEEDSQSGYEEYDFTLSEKEKAELDETGQKATRAFREIFGNKSEGTFLNHRYLTADYTDSEGRWAEIRLLQAQTHLTLNANIGDGLALIELQQIFEEKGVHVGLLGSFDAPPAVQKILAEHSDKIK